MIAEMMSRIAPPQARRSLPSDQHQHQAEDLRREQDAMVRANSVKARSGSNRGQIGIERKSRVKYSGRM